VKRANSREESIERGGRGFGHHPCATIQTQRVVFVPVPTLAADAVVDEDIDLCVQVQGEDVRGGEWIAPLAP
jgi:hypothetical protein